MVAAYRDSIKVHESGTSISINPASTDGGLTYSANDGLLLHIWGITSIAAPSGSDVTWTEEWSDSIVGPFSNTYCHKVYSGIADASLTSFTIALGAADSHAACLSSYSGVDTGDLIDGTAAGNSDLGSVSVNPIAPAVSPTSSDALLVCAAGAHETLDTSVTYTAPSGMTEREDWPTAAAYEHFSLATLALSASGSTGAKTFDIVPDIDSSEVYLTSSVAIKSSGGGGTPHATTVDDNAGSTDDQSVVATAPITWSYGVRMGT
jgi:hypothetical protein